MSVNATNPGSFIGGTWERLKDRFLLAAGDTYAAGSTGGEAQHMLKIWEMPVHDHQIWTQYGTGNEETWAYVGTNTKTLAHYPEDGIRRVSTAGGGQAHNNMPPYLAVYMWVRTA